MRAVILAVLGLAATGAVADTPNSWNAVVQVLPTCAQKCMNDYYQEVYSDKCGSNSANANLKCICTATDSSGNVSNDNSDLSSCIEDSCPDHDSSDANQLESASNDILNMCSPYLDDSSSTDTSTDAASSLSLHMPTLMGATGFLGAMLL